MDPRTAAKVTAPDLKKAFEEGSGGAGKLDPASELTIWMVFAHQDVGPQERREYAFVGQLDLALETAKDWLRKGYKYAVAIVVSVDEPKAYTDAQAAPKKHVSQLEQ